MVYVEVLATQIPCRLLCVELVVCHALELFRFHGNVCFLWPDASSAVRIGRRLQFCLSVFGLEVCYQFEKIKDFERVL